MSIKRQRLSTKCLIIMALTLLAGNLVLSGQASASAPRVMISEDHFDFGQVFEDRQLSHTFVIKNVGDSPLKISKVDPDCACTVANYDHTIPPGGQGEISLSIKPYSVMHKFRKEARVWVNDPNRSEFSLALTGTAKPFIEIAPSHIVRLRGAPGDDLKGEVRFTSHLPGPFEITNFHTNIPDKIEVSLKPVQPGKIYILEVKNKATNSGPYAGLVELSTTSKERPRMIVRVFGEIYLPSASGQ
ncbi:MAG: DUF1573 domain-containing protein [Deltaproteobacteria bacterium]|nr:DUF1573 domain-containing protein [Deltaproteobacteria bacterium]